MTIARDHHGGKRKPSWESKISISTGSTRPVGRTDTPSSILSSDSDIRFTRRLGGQYRCGCCIVAGFLLFLLVAAITVYVAYTFILSRSAEERVFRVHFRVTDGDTFSSPLADPATEQFRVHARGYRERINLIFRRSPLRPAFLKTDILALDGSEGKDLIVHFNVHFDARRMSVEVPDLIQVLSREITQREPVYLNNLTIPLESLSVKESSLDLSTSLPTILTTLPPPTTPEQPRQCSPVQLGYCGQLTHNLTSYPNILGHKNYGEVLDDVIRFREIVDSECYRHAYEFVCNLLQPSCKNSTIQFPCRSFCNDFLKGCGSRVSSHLRAALDCSTFPEASSSGSCLPAPGCVEDLHASGMGVRVCDGVIDCPDMSDETSCSYCGRGDLHCGAGKVCIPRGKLCDGEPDCPDSSDERNCLSIASPLTSAMTLQSRTPHQDSINAAGYVVAQENGVFRKVCVDSFNSTEDDTDLQDLAASVCRLSSYSAVKSYRSERDQESKDSKSLQYVEVDDLEATRPLFLSTPCSEKKVLHVACQVPECGRQVLRQHSGIHGLPKMAAYGDWPWHVALLKDGVHLCDGTLLAPEWVITTASCFQGQSKAEWLAKLGGAIRIESASPWQQERLIVGMLKSPVEGSTLVLLNLNEPAVLSQFVRPICLPDPASRSDNYNTCTTLGWSTTKKHLQRIDLEMTPMGICENISIPTVNSLCTESPFSSTDCNEEEFAGSPLLCLSPEKTSWTLVGVSNWRIGCQQPGLERPRMYDKVQPNLQWIKTTLHSTSST